ncbi:transposase [Nocardia sp. NPDC059239]|uniref:transposase n=1 Tax=Nocardia sp. NPDC059239 TaxID=3346785 RepID=UPI00368109DD
MSPWDVAAVRKVLSAKACELIGPQAWAIHDTGFAKDGDASACVAAIRATAVLGHSRGLSVNYCRS